MDPEPNEATIRLYRETLLDPELRALRESFCRTTAASLTNVAGWLGVDSFLGGGDIDGAMAANPSGADPERHVAFRAAATVIEMASELVTGAVALLDNGQRFAASTLIRQLLETEYLLKAFLLDFATAARWAASSPDDIRKSFAPRTMRAVGGFSNDEYWRHCDIGGHPAPSGRALLRYNLAVPPNQDSFMTASVWGDLAQHLRRLWITSDELLRREHARYENVRERDRAPVWEVMERWVNVDPLASTVDFRFLDETANRSD